MTRGFNLLLLLFILIVQNESHEHIFDILKRPNITLKDAEKFVQNFFEIDEQYFQRKVKTTSKCMKGRILSSIHEQEIGNQTFYNYITKEYVHFRVVTCPAQAPICGLKLIERMRSPLKWYRRLLDITFGCFNPRSLPRCDTTLSDPIYHPTFSKIYCFENYSGQLRTFKTVGLWLYLLSLQHETKPEIIFKSRIDAIRKKEIKEDDAKREVFESPDYDEDEDEQFMDINVNLLKAKRSADSVKISRANNFDIHNHIFSNFENNTLACITFVFISTFCKIIYLIIRLITSKKANTAPEGIPLIPSQSVID